MPRMRRPGRTDHLSTRRAVQRLRLVRDRLRQEIPRPRIRFRQQRLQGVQKGREEAGDDLEREQESRQTQIGIRGQDQEAESTNPSESAETRLGTRVLATRY